MVYSPQTHLVERGLWVPTTKGNPATTAARQPTYVEHAGRLQTLVVLPPFFCSSLGTSLRSFRLLIKTVMATAAMA